MLLKNTQTGDTFNFTFEAVGACDPETLAFAISEAKQHNLEVTRIVSIVGLDELMEKGWIRSMLQMAEEANIRLIVPPVSPLMEMYNGKLETRWNASTPEGPWLGTAMNNDTIRECIRVMEEFMDTYGDEFSFEDNFGILATDLGLLNVLPLELFTKVSVLCGTSNIFKALDISYMGANSINLVPMQVEQVKEIAQDVSSLVDVYMVPPGSICPPWYDREAIIALAPKYVEAGAFVLKAECTETVAQLLDHDYLMNIAIPQQTQVFISTLSACSTAPYELVKEEQVDESFANE